MGGSSAIITAALRALCAYFNVEIPPAVQATLALETETRELGVPAGLQDRVIQAYEGLVYMDFAKDISTVRAMAITNGSIRDCCPMSIWLTVLPSVKEQKYFIPMCASAGWRKTRRSSRR